MAWAPNARLQQITDLERDDPEIAKLGEKIRIEIRRGDAGAVEAATAAFNAAVARRLGPEVLAEARGWVLDCAWAEDPDELAALPDVAILAGLRRHYVGGLDQFLRDITGP